MSMIGIQSKAYHCQLNGLRIRVPYDVGRSISTCATTPIVETARRVANGASSSEVCGGVDSGWLRRRASERRRTLHTIAATTTASTTTPSGPCVGPRCHSRYFVAPPAAATMSMSGAFDERSSAAVVPLPRDLESAIDKFGIATLKRNGMLPWRARELFGDLRRTFEGFKRGTLYGPSDVILFSGALGHYIQDAHQPLHATNNYDGQLTRNQGVHARFERDLVEKFLPRLRIEPRAPAPMPNARDAAFEALLSSYQQVDPVLKADSEAAAGKDVYDTEYFEKFFTRVRPVLEARLSAAITATASAFIGAWEQAGRPTATLDSVRPGERVKGA